MSANEKIFPAPDILNEVEYGKFVLTNLAAKRAKQIKEGAPPLVRIDTNHPLSIALEEIAQGKIKPILGSDAQAAELDEDYSALDLLGLGDLGFDDEDEDDEDEVELDDSLKTLLADDEEEEVVADEEHEDDDVAVVADDETPEISLDDLASEEEAGNEEDKED